MDVKIINDVSDVIVGVSKIDVKISLLNILVIKMHNERFTVAIFGRF